MERAVGIVLLVPSHEIGMRPENIVSTVLRFPHISLDHMLSKSPLLKFKFISKPTSCRPGSFPVSATSFTVDLFRHIISDLVCDKYTIPDLVKLDHTALDAYFFPKNNLINMKNRWFYQHGILLQIFIRNAVHSLTAWHTHCRVNQIQSYVA